MRQAYRRRPWRVPNPGVNDEELNGGSSSTSRPPRLPGAAAASSTRVGFLFGARRRPLRAHQGRQVCLFGERQPPLLRDCHGRGQDPLHPACLGAAMDCSRLCIRRRSSGRGRAAVAAPGRGRGAGGRAPRASAGGGRRRNGVRAVRVCSTAFWWCAIALGLAAASGERPRATSTPSTRHCVCSMACAPANTHKKRESNRH